MSDGLRSGQRGTGRRRLRIEDDGSDESAVDESAGDESSGNEVDDEESPDAGSASDENLLDLGELPVLPGGSFELLVEPLDGCGMPEGPGSVTIVPFASARGLAASVSGDIDGTLYMGAGMIEFQGRTAHVTRNDVPSADTDHLTLMPGADALEGVWQHRLLDGADAESVGIDEGVCDFGGTIMLSSPDWPVLRAAITNTPPLDLDVLQVEDVVCERTPDGIRVKGVAPGGVLGEGLVLHGSISADEFIDLGETLAVVSDDGRFEAVFSYDGDETHVSVVARRGVYQAGGHFFDDCE